MNEPQAKAESTDAWTPLSEAEAERLLAGLAAAAEQHASPGDPGAPDGGPNPDRGHFPRVRKSRRRGAIAGVTGLAGVVMLVGIAGRWIVSGNDANLAPSGSIGASLAGPVTDPGAAVAPDGPASEHTKDSHMNRSTAAILAGITMTASASAQNAAVQWRVADGGNGHWYSARLVSQGVSWEDARDSAVAAGGALASLETLNERSFVFSAYSPSATPTAFVQQADGSNAWFGPWIGGWQAPNSPEPYGGWSWLSGGSFNPVIDYCCNDDCGGANEDKLHLYFLSGGVMAWNDLPSIVICGRQPVSYLVEWSADCNNDGIVDYGQCRDGTLPDFDGDNIPDCCERGEACAVGIHPVQWRVDDGGNGHWYGIDSKVRQWPAADDAATRVGAHLATITDASENQHCVDLALQLDGADYWLGAKRGVPGGPFQWTTGEQWSYSAWLPGQPDDYRGDGCYPDGEPWLELPVRPPLPIGWNDEGHICVPGNRSLLEWDADCNHDGIVDFGQMLLGELPDINHNGIPDTCECIGDLYVDGVINGADLGTLLAYWGPATSAAASRACDLNADGVVNGSDLGILLAYWGTCGH